jgi:hypothetical protein
MRLPVVAILVVGGLLAASLLGGGDRSPARTAADLRLALVRAFAADPDQAAPRVGSAPAGRSNVVAFPQGRRIYAKTAKGGPGGGSTPSFGQPTIVAVAGWGFEPDLRHDPSNANRLYVSSPDSAGSDTSWIWRSLDAGKTFKWVPAAAPLNGKVIPCPGGGDTELAVDGAGRLYFNDLTLVNFSVSRSDDQGRTFLPCNSTAVPDAVVDRQWYALDGDPTAGGSLYLASDEVGNGYVQCGPTQVNNTLVMYRSPAAGVGSTAGLQFAQPNHITQPGTCDEGIMGANEVSPVATTTGQLGRNGRPAQLATPVRHVYVIHDDGSLSKIQIARCFPVVFGAPVANVSDPSGLNCVDLPVADLGPGQRTGGNFPSLAIDRAGNLYAVWEQAPYDGTFAGDTTLWYAYSTNEGASWSAPVQIPTPGLANNVFAWAAAGDDGRVDIAWYGAAGHVDPAGGPQKCPNGNGGPDTVAGPWSVYLTQTLNAHAKTVTFTAPILASEHPIRRGGIQTIIGNQCGGATNLGLDGFTRALGDFFQLRIGPLGQAEISYGDSNNVDGQAMGTHAMFVQQVAGASVYQGQQLTGSAPVLGSSSDVGGDATFDALGSSSASMPNLDIRSSSVTKPLASACHPAGTACYRVAMKVTNLSLTAPASPDTDTDIVWQTQWLVPATANCSEALPSCHTGGLNFHVYAESNQGGAVECWVGQNAIQQNLDGFQLTYPGATQLTEPGQCAVVNGPNGTITIDVPISLVSLDAGVAPYSSRLYSVTASTMTLGEKASTVPSLAGIGGTAFNLIDVAPGYDANP